MRSKLALGTLTVVTTLISSGTALAQAYQTQEQVRAELAEMIRKGDVYVVVAGDSSRKAAEMVQSVDPGEAGVAGQTQRQEKADPERATGDSIPSGNGGYPGYDYVLPFGE